MSGNPESVQKAWITRKKKYSAAQISAQNSKAGRLAHIKHPDLAKFKNRELASKAGKKSTRHKHVFIDQPIGIAQCKCGALKDE